MSSTTGKPLPRRRLDIVIIGAGIAGLTFALRCPPDLRIALLTKGVLGESNTRYAQGGLAAAIGEDDTPALHEADTLAAGAGLCDPITVHRLVAAAPAAVDWLIGLGARFDRGPDGEPLLGLEAAHSRHRVLHAGGDATGWEVERALVAHLSSKPHIESLAGAFALDLVVADGRCQGVLARLAVDGTPTLLEAPITVLAAGGAGQLWATSSNPAGATADGLAMALRAGVSLADVEFVQFHPTVLKLPGTTPFLVSEAVRGEGAYLRDGHGNRFMPALHPLAELAPRDVVARAIQRQLALDGSDAVNLDLRHLEPAAIRTRFPSIARELAARGLDLATDLIPVAPAAHYFIGGVAATPEGRTSLPGLLALGEAACTGIHGANRLASNSLLEGLVFGIAAADAVRGQGSGGGGQVGDSNLTAQRLDRAISVSPGEVARLRERLQQTMSRYVAVVRDGSGLGEAAREIEAIAARLEGATTSLATEGDEIAGASLEMVRAGHELRNMVDAAGSIIAAATHRAESRGAHFRSDFPESQPALDGQHSVWINGRWRFGSLAEAWSAPVSSIRART